jgi:hypothetical protein
MHIPFATLSQRHLVYAYLAVCALHAAYVTRLAVAWRRTKRP